MINPSGQQYGRVLLVAVLIFLGVLTFAQKNTTEYLVYEQERLHNQLAQSYLVQTNQQELIASMAEELSIELEGLRTETSSQIAATAEQVSATKQELQSAIAEQAEVSLTEVINEWRSRIAFVQCRFNFLGATLTQRGAATFFVDEGAPVLITNRHVLEPYSGTYESCYYRFPQDTDNITFAEQFITFGQTAEDVDKPDYATIELTEPNQFVKDLMAQETNYVCTEEPEVGDGVIILGFPTIGSTRDVTATEGIIAAIEDSHFVTSAKVDSGNSGGAAIHVDDKCYLGIPTFTALGQAESLARILRADTISF